MEPAKVFAVLCNPATYASWWPAECRVRLIRACADGIGSQFAFQIARTECRCEVVRIVPGHEILIAYIQGPYRGTGVWSLEAVEQGTRICYDVQVVPAGWWAWVRSRLLGFDRRHAEFSERLLESLERRQSAEHG